MSTRTCTFAWLIALSLSACAPTGSSQDPQEVEWSERALTFRERGVLSVFDHHVARFEAGDLDGLLEDYCERSVLITADGVFRGKEQIRAFYASLLAEFGTIDDGASPGITFNATTVEGNVLFTTWNAESIHLVFPFGTDTFVIRGGHIMQQTVAFSLPEPKAPVPP